MPPPTRAFIAYDFALSEGTMFDNTLEDALSSQPPELDLHYPGARGEPKDQGTIWESMVRREIGLAKKVLAFIDLPNANVGFEIGYAFGSGKHVGVFRFKNTEHRWLKQPPLRGHFRFQASTADQIHQAFLKDNFIVLQDPPAGGDGVILLCPEASGVPLLKQVDPAWGWATPPFSEWDIVSMPRQFKDAGLVVWIITAHGEGPAERDGTENTALSILAGYAEARPELTLKIFVHQQARPVADVEHVAKRFSTNSELKAMLGKLHEEWQATLAGRKTQPAPPPEEPAVKQTPVTPACFVGNHQHLTYDLQPVLTKTLDDLDKGRIDKLLSQPLSQKLNASLRRAAEGSSASMQKQLENLLCMYAGRPTLGALLCFAHNDCLGDKAGCCTLQMVTHDSPERGGESTSIDLERGNLFYLYEKGMAWLCGGSVLRRKGTVGSKSRDDFEIPVIVFREALVNALVHRDYESRVVQGQPTRIDVYPDKVEITSYGSLLEPVSLQSLNEPDQNLRPWRRNEAVALIFQCMTEAELNASGISRMRRLMTEAGLPLPLFRAGDHFVCVTLARPFDLSSAPVPSTDFSKVAVVNTASLDGVRGKRTAFISSTYADMSEHRKAAEDACLRAGIFSVIGGERSSDVETKAIDLMQSIDASDLFICILGQKYGAVHENTGISFVETEFNFAVKRGLPILVFTMHQDHPVTSDVFSEDTLLRPKLEAFKKRALSKASTNVQFKSPQDLRDQLFQVLKALPQAAAAPLLCPHGLPPHPYDLFPDTAARFIGREAQLGSGADAVEGMLQRFKNPAIRLSGGRAVQWLWAHGFGGMGKSWCLHRIRCIAQQAHPEIRALIIDWDKPEWLAPLQGEPRTPLEVFDLIAIRLCQCLPQADESAITAYREAKARVVAAAAEHKRVHDRFEQHLQLASTGAGVGAGAGAGELVRRLRDEGLWHDDPVRREALLKTLRESRLRHREMFAAWCLDLGEVNPAVISPTHELAHGLRASLSAAMQQHPLIVVLDTCEVLQEDLDFWMRELFAPLITAAAPLLLLIGSRLRPDLHQPKGSRRGWLTDQLPAAARRIEDFGESLRFSINEIEHALDQLRRPVAGDHARLAEIMHRVTLGVPLAVRGLLDLHEDGDDALTHLSAPTEDEEPLSEKKAVEKVIANVCERWLYNLETKPERVEDLQDVIALALLPVLDQGLMREFWQPQSPYNRLRDLSRKYSLLTDGDLHPTVRSYLRRHWRAEVNRPECLPEVLDRLAHAHAQVSVLFRPASRVQQLQHRIATLNLRSWREGDAIVPELARALCLARVYEVEDLTLETLLSELPLAGGAYADARKLWHRDDSQRPVNAEILPWLISQLATAQSWTAEEDAALSLLQGSTMQGWKATPAVASEAMGHLERAVAFFGLDSLPLLAQAGEAYFSVGYSLHPDAPHKPSADFASMSAEAFERAIALHCREAIACNNVANLYIYYLNQPERAEQSYLRGIELDPENAYLHNGLGILYLLKLNQPERAEQSYLRAIELDPKFAHPHHGLGNLYQDHLHRPGLAEQSYLRAIELDPKAAYPHHGLGDLYQHHLNQPERAEQCHRKAIELDPKVVHPHDGLGSLYEAAERWPQAVAEFGLANSLDASSGSGCRGLAWVALRSGGAVAEAQDWARQAFEREIEHPGNDLLSIALEAWADAWAPALARWAAWVRALPPHQDGFVRANHDRIAALLRRVHAAGHLPAWVAELRPARPCWQPFVQAVDAFLQGAQPPALADPLAAAILRELQTPDAPAPPKPRSRKKP